ncbi:MAG: hypothetical protein N2255_03610 [Kiritimatiellae bacterium]|nr:hypothetical protein [Kiritimatiellia bacterium]
MFCASRYNEYTRGISSGGSSLDMAFRTWMIPEELTRPVNIAAPRGMLGLGVDTNAVTERLTVAGNATITGRVAAASATFSGPVQASSANFAGSVQAASFSGAADGLTGVPKIRAAGLLPNKSSIKLEIPHYVLFTLQLSSGWPDSGGLAHILGFENQNRVAVTYTAYNGDGTSTYGGTGAHESTTNILVQFGNSSYRFTVRCPGEIDPPHNIVLEAQGVELLYRLIY